MMPRTGGSTRAGNVTLLNMAPKAMPGLGGKMSKSEEPERPPIDFERIDGEKLVEKSLFKLR